MWHCFSIAGKEFYTQFRALLAHHGDIAYAELRLLDQPQVLFHAILELGYKPARSSTAQTNTTLAQLEQQLFQAVGENAREKRWLMF